MTVDRYGAQQSVRVGSLVVAIAINAGVIGALMLSTPVFRVLKGDKSLLITSVPLDEPPPPLIEIAPQRQPDARTAAQPERVDASRSVTATSDYVVPNLPPLPLPPLPLSLPTGEATVIDPPAQPVLIGAEVDPRYASDLQPHYPAGERRAEREGSVTVRVTIGADGRVATVECLSATTTEFCRATRQQALAKWRFRPATRDGVPVTATKDLTVRFELES